MLAKAELDAPLIAQAKATRFYIMRCMELSPASTSENLRCKMKASLEAAHYMFPGSDAAGKWSYKAR